jgi:hypothetical protein
MIRVQRLNNNWIIVTGANENAGFDRCWNGSAWTKRPSSAKRFATRIEAQAAIEREREKMESAA